jgi:arylsulfatase A-like enzyme
MGSSLGRRALASPRARGRRERPNVLLILADDLGFGDLSINGNRTVDTPNLHRFASESVRFEQFTVGSVCAPTRASLFTGRHFWRTGVSGVHAGKEFLNLNESTMADSFRANGYATGMWGKWHSGKTDGYFPWDRGFDDAYMAHLYTYQDNQGRRNGRPWSTSGWATEVLTSFAIEFIHARRQEPFFAYLPYMTPHTPWEAPPRLVDKYRARGLSLGLATVYGMIEFLDQQIGRLLQALDRAGLREDTIVLFLSDNGPERYDGRHGGLSDEDWLDRNRHGLRGRKGQNFENGIRAPLFVRWSGSFEPRVVRRLVDIADVYPTLLDLTGIHRSGTLPLDGRSVRRYLEGDVDGLPAKTVYIAQWHPFVDGRPQEYDPVVDPLQLRFEDQSIAIRTEQYKLSYYWGESYLFDLVADPGEQQNLYGSRSDLVEDLRTQLREWFDSVKREPGAFSAPEFLIGQDGRQQSLVLAYGPSRVGGQVQNHNHDSRNWGRAGDFAEYRLRVLTAGEYAIGLAYTDPNGPQRATVKLTVEGAGSRWLTLDDRWWAEAEPLFLPAGPALLRVELTCNFVPYDVLREIYLTRR